VWHLQVPTTFSMDTSCSDRAGTHLGLGAGDTCLPYMSDARVMGVVYYSDRPSRASMPSWDLLPLTGGTGPPLALPSKPFRSPFLLALPRLARPRCWWVSQCLHLGATQGLRQSATLTGCRFLLPLLPLPAQAFTPSGRQTCTHVKDLSNFP
jgi:hypothetical protein